MPRPAAGEVLIEVSACGMNNTDVWVREGAYGTDEDADATASWRRTAFRHLVGYIEAGKIKALLGGLYRLSDFHQAQSDLMAKGFVGKLVVVPDAKWEQVNAALEGR